MSDGPEWFAPKRYGLGATPISWQGWALTIAYVLLAIGLSVEFATWPLQLFAILVLPTVVFMVISAKTTRGGWRWRWGEED